MREGKTNRGRPRYGDEPKPKFVKFGISMPPDLYDRLEKYCESDERDKSWAIRKALEPWLSERGF